MQHKGHEEHEINSQNARPKMIFVSFVFFVLPFRTIVRAACHAAAGGDSSTPYAD
jgi:hypothetical protein